MREIKFKAWLKETKEMLIFEPLSITTPVFYSQDYPDNYFWGDGKRNFRLQANREDCKNYNHDDFNEPPEEEWVLMQYTGLHDINGEEIYESDVIKAEHRNGAFNNPTERKSQFTIVWEMDGFKAKRKGRKSFYQLSLLKNIERIGDIYNNPDFLQ